MRVRDAVTGDPVEGAEIKVYAEGLPYGWSPTGPRLREKPVAQSGSTLQDGRFYLENALDSFAVEVHAGGFAPTGAGPFTGASEHVVWLQPASELSLATLQVRVVGAYGEVWPGITVELVRSAPARGEKSDGVVAARATDFQGRCSFEGLESGHYSARVPQAGKRWTTPFFDVGRDPAHLIIGNAARSASLAMRLIDPAGNPRRFYPVELVRRELLAWGGYWERTRFGARADLDGRVALPSLPAGVYLVQLGGEGKWDTRGYTSLDGVDPPARSLHWGDDRVIEVADGETLEVEYVVGTSALRGRVLLPESAPGARGGIRLSGRRAARVSVNEDGTFEMRAAAPGDYLLRAENFGAYGSTAIPVHVPRYGDAPFVEVPLERHALVRAAVEGPDGASVPGVRVYWIDADRVVALEKEFRGKRRVEFAHVPVPPGEQTFVARTYDGRDIRRVLRVKPGRNDVLVFQLP